MLWLGCSLDTFLTRCFSSFALFLSPSFTHGRQPPKKSLFDEDAPRVKEGSQSGFFASLMKRFADASYIRQQKSIQERISRIQPKVNNLVSTKKVEELDEDERQILNDYTSLNQDMQTYRRRKFMSDVSAHVNSVGKNQPSQWEELEAELKQDVQTRQAQRHPGGSRGRLWAQEARYRIADDYSRETQRQTDRKSVV